MLDYEIPVYFVGVKRNPFLSQLCNKEKDFIVIARPIRCSGANYETDSPKRSVQRQTFHYAMELLIRRLLCYGGEGWVDSYQTVVKQGQKGIIVKDFVNPFILYIFVDIIF